MTYTCGVCGAKNLTAKDAKDHLHNGRFEFTAEGALNVGDIPSLNVREPPDPRMEALKAGQRVRLGGP